MYLSPDKGFKYSIHENPASEYSLLSMGNIPHGKVTYDLNKNTATYYPPTTKNVDELPVILLISGDNDTMESWFKVGGANAVVDKMLAEGKTIPYILTTDTSLKDRAVVVMPASINKTWSSRRIALEQVLLR
jgi:enterochelin esterase-like enzyme